MFDASKDMKLCIVFIYKTNEFFLIPCLRNNSSTLICSSELSLSIMAVVMRVPFGTKVSWPLALTTLSIVVVHKALPLLVRLIDK